MLKHIWQVRGTLHIYSKHHLSGQWTRSRHPGRRTEDKQVVGNQGQEAGGESQTAMALVRGVGIHLFTLLSSSGHQIIHPSQENVKCTITQNRSIHTRSRARIEPKQDKRNRNARICNSIEVVRGSVTPWTPHTETTAFRPPFLQHPRSQNNWSQ